MKKNLIGNRFTRLVVIAEAKSRRMPNGDSKTMWRCRCDCGKEIDADASKLVQQCTKSCGCLRSELIGKSTRTHGMTGTKEYRAWHHMIGRCERPTDGAFRYYGAEGISVCPRWRQSFEEFLQDMGRAPGPQFSIERLDVRKGYSPSNCIWATRLEQQNNRRNNVLVELEGRRMTLSQFARKHGVTYKGLHKLYRTKNLPLSVALARASRIKPSE